MLCLSLDKPKEPSEVRELLPPSSEHLRIGFEDPGKQERQIQILVEDHIEAPSNLTLASSQISEVEAMDVDEEAQLLSDVSFGLTFVEISRAGAKFGLLKR